MTITMSRMVLAGALALGALAAIGGFTPGVAEADAAPNGSPFAGTYWTDGTSFPSGGFGGWNISISASGGLAGYGTGWEQGASITGKVTRAGALACKYNSGAKLTGTVALDVNGDIVGSTTTGRSILWHRN